MNGLGSVAGAFARRAAVLALALSSVFVLATPGTRIDAYNGGTSFDNPAALPCPPDCQFTGDNTGEGLTGYQYGLYGNYNATWWSFTAPATRTYTFHAASVNPQGWDNTLTVTNATGTVLAHSDDVYGYDAMLSVDLTSGTSYRLALAGFGTESVGTATITISSSPPDAPTNVSGTEGDGSVALTWTAPNDHYAAITEYRVYVNGSTEYTSFFGTPPDPSGTIEGLTNGVSHTFRVSAVNGNGEGAKSLATEGLVPHGATTTAITFSPATPSYNTPFDVVVTVTGSSTINTGSVHLYRGAADLGTAQVVDGVATWSETRPVGRTNYRADFAGLPAWTSSSSGQVSVDVGKASQTITFAQPADTAHSVGTFTVAPTASSELTVTLASATTSVCTVSGFTVTLVTGGTCTLTASQAGDTNYNAAELSRSFKVTDAPQTITFAQPTSKAYSLGTFTVAPTSTSGLTVTLTSDTTSVCTVDGFTVTLVTGGTCTLTAAHAGNAFFAAASPVTRSFQVTGAPQTITFAQPTSKAYSLGTFTVAPTSSSGLAVALDSDTPSVCTVSGFTVTIVTGGTCTLSADQDGDANFAAADTVERDVTVTGAPQTITFARPADRQWSATTFDVAPTSSSGLTVTLTSDSTSVCTVSTFTVTMVRTGMCTLTASQAGDTNFDSASLQRSFEISGATQSALTTISDTYELFVGDTAEVDTNGGSGTGAVTYEVTSGSANCSLVGTILTATGGGTCVVTGTKAGDAQYAAASDASNVITVLKQQPQITITGTASVVTGASTTVTVAVTDLLADHAPGAITLQLSGTTTGALSDPSSASLVVAENGLSGTATFTVTTGQPGSLDVDARMAATTAYEQVDTATPATITVTQPPAALIPTVPSRIIDTRPGYAHVRPAPDRQLAAGEVLEVQFTDLPGLVPASGVEAVSLDIGVVGPDGDGFITAYPCGDMPTVSSLNFRSGQTISNAAIVPVNDLTGSVCFYPSRATHLIVDVTGWLATNNGFEDVAPTRLVDTRPDHTAISDMTDVFTTGQVREVTVTGLANLTPSNGVAAVSLNLTVVNPAAPGYVSAYACGERPNASSVNFAAGRTVANLAIVPVSTGGSVCFYASQPLHLVVDINGWFEAGQGFGASGPARVFDTRPGYSGLRSVTSEPLGEGQVLTVKVTDLDGLVPASNVGAVSLNVTAIDPAGDGFLEVWACGTRPDASSLNYAAHRTTAGAVIAPVDQSTGTVCFYTSQTAHLAVDLNGWFIAAQV